MEVTLIDSMGSDLSVVNAARVSFHKESLEFTEQDGKLIRYLAKHKHTSPFNHAFLTFRVKAPIFVARQLVKHKFMPWNEVSRRYVDDEPEFYFPSVWRGKPLSSKQGSDGEVDWNTELTEDFCLYSLNLYNAMLEKMAPEQARMVLPQNTMTEWIWSGTLGAYLDMLKLRIDPHAQYESRQVAEKIAEKVKERFPHSYEAVLEQRHD